MKNYNEKYVCLLSYRDNLTIDYVRNHRDELNWKDICTNLTLTEDFIREFKDKVDWKEISYYQVLSENFIREFKDKVDWEMISMSQILSEDFMREFKDKLDLRYIKRRIPRQLLSESFIKEFKLDINADDFIMDCINLGIKRYNVDEKYKEKLLLDIMELDYLIKIIRDNQNSISKYYISDILVPYLNLLYNKQVPDDIIDNNTKNIIDGIPLNILNFRQHLHFSRYIRNLILKYQGFAILTNNFISDLSKYIGDGKCLEICAGIGALSSLLQRKGISCIATDNYEYVDSAVKNNDADCNWRSNWKNTWTDVIRMDAEEAIRKYVKDVDYVILSWSPSDNEMDYRCLQLMKELNPKCKMICIIEDCTNSELFKRNININSEESKIVNEHFRTFYGLNDKVIVIENIVID